VKPEDAYAIADDPTWGPLFRFLWESGARVGEALALTGAQCEATEAGTTVRIEPHELPDGSTWRPKRPASIRSLRLPPRVVPSTLPCAYVFLPDRRPVFNVQVNRALARRCATLGLPRYTSHDFRRYRITQALLAGAEPLQLSRAVGHASLKTTAGYVRHVPLLCELCPSDAEPVANPAAAAWKEPGAHWSHA